MVKSVGKYIILLWKMEIKLVISLIKNKVRILPCYETYIVCTRLEKKVEEEKAKEKKEEVKERNGKKGMKRE